MLNTVCRSHHRQYNCGYYVFVPSKLQREVLLYHEHRDFARRESLITKGEPDPGRWADYSWRVVLISCMTDSLYHYCIFLSAYGIPHRSSQQILRSIRFGPGVDNLTDTSTFCKRVVATCLNDHRTLQRFEWPKYILKYVIIQSRGTLAERYMDRKSTIATRKLILAMKV